MSSEPSKPKRWPRLLGVNLLVFAAMLIVLEGLASLTLFTWRVARGPEPPRPMAEVRHAEFDPDLGWVNLPNAHVTDLYGPGRNLTTNSRGFRGSVEIENAEPPGADRVICSGDSFTLGYGVGDDDTWCARLAVEAPGFQPVNMGQGGYGVDQAFLWYERDARDIEHSVHIFAFITHDFERMMTDRFVDFPKPLLDVENGRLVATNTPLGAPVAPTGERARYLRRTVRRLGLVQLGEAALSKLGFDVGPANARPAEVVYDVDKARRIFGAVIDSLATLNEGKGSRLVLVHFPTDDEVTAVEGPTDGWRDWLRATAGERGVTFVDLLPVFRALPAPDVTAMYIQDGSTEFVGASGHFTEAGNRFVAEELGRWLVADRTAGR